MPGTVVTSMVKRVDVAVYEAIHEATLGRFQGGKHVFGLQEDGIDYVHEGPHGQGIPEDVKARVAALRPEVVSGVRPVPSE